MVWLLSVLIGTTFLSSYAEETLTLPTYVEVCYRNDPKVSDCIKNAIEKLLPIFKSGSEDFDLDALDPMVVKDLEFRYKSPLVGGSIVVPKSTISGYSDIKVTDVRLNLDDPSKFVLDFDVFLPRMNIESYYKLAGNVIQAPVKMNGHVDMNLADLNLTYHLSGSIKQVDGVDFLDLESFRGRLKGEGVRRLDLLNDDVVYDRPVLNRLVVTVVKSSWRLLKNHMLPTLLPEADKPTTAMFKKFFKKYPYDVIFPREK